MTVTLQYRPQVTRQRIENLPPTLDFPELPRPGSLVDIDGNTVIIEGYPTFAFVGGTFTGVTVWVKDAVVRKTR